MDTVIDVLVTNVKKAKADSTWPAIDSLLKDWEERFSVTTQTSEVKRVNDRVCDTLPISKQLGEMIDYAVRYGDLLDGGFDLTILPLKRVWGLAEDSPEDAPIPTKEQIDSARALVNFKQVKVNTKFDTLYLSSSHVKIDIGGVAKGFAIKRVDALLKNRGITDYLINAGGDIIGSGRKAQNSPWTIGIQDPRNSAGVIASFGLDSGSVFTSGDYERFRIINGKRVHHLFNPHTGYSSTGNQSVTVYGPDPIENKFLSTGLFCRPADSILSFVNRNPKIECLVVDSSGNVFVSNRWKDRINLQK